MRAFYQSEAGVDEIEFAALVLGFRRMSAPSGYFACRVACRVP